MDEGTIKGTNTSRRLFLQSAGALATIAAVPGAAILTEAEAFTLPSVLNHELVNAFCGLADIEKDRGLIFTIVSRAKEYTTEWFDDDTKTFVTSKNDNSYHPPAFTFKSEFVSLENTRLLAKENPYDFFKELPIETVKRNRHEIMRMASRIATNSRRGFGNKILHHPDDTKDIKEVDPFKDHNSNPVFQLVPFNQLKRGEYVILYAGNSQYDRPINKVKFADDPKFYYYPNKNFDKYAIRFKFAENT